jgi:hypothetical protein
MNGGLVWPLPRISAGLLHRVLELVGALALARAVPVCALVEFAGIVAELLGLLRRRRDAGVGFRFGDTALQQCLGVFRAAVPGSIRSASPI